mmetsp:Transcript_6236/g.14122  ORF Transcript_6236/g.14122 Transcript_6236/m.14122 type:complete len:93 (+) Transcript_6236:2611-2889(+)
MPRRLVQLHQDAARVLFVRLICIVSRSFVPHQRQEKITAPTPPIKFKELALGRLPVTQAMLCVLRGCDVFRIQYVSRKGKCYMQSMMIEGTF